VGTRNASTANAFVGLDPTTGGRNWAFDNGGGASGIGIINGQAAVDASANRVYFASRARAGGSNGTLWCLSFTNATASLCSGSWPRALGDIDGSPVLAGSALYVGTNGGTVYAVDPATGTTLWSNALGDGAIKGFVWPVYNASPGVFYVSTTNKVHRLTYTSGSAATVTWSASIAGASIPYYDGARLYLGSTDGRLHQLSNLGNSTPTDTLLVIGAGTDAVGSAAVDTSGQLNVGTDAGVVYSLKVPY
jgi:outer membrane protein assembly factor BamB